MDRLEYPFYRAWLDDPDDLTNLLVWADWCEDRGQEGRAAFLRYQAAPLGVGHSVWKLGKRFRDLKNGTAGLGYAVCRGTLDGTHVIRIPHWEMPEWRRGLGYELWQLVGREIGLSVRTGKGAKARHVTVLRRAVIVRAFPHGTLLYRPTGPTIFPTATEFRAELGFVAAHSPAAQLGRT